MHSECKEGGCTKEVIARGWCRSHYNRWRDGQQEPCKEADCTAPAKARGWCNRHYLRWLRNRDPTHSEIKRWTKDAIVEAISLWTERFGEPPTSTDWLVATREHPTSQTVRNQFGSFNGAIDAAGEIPWSPPPSILPGEKFGRLTVVEDAGLRKHRGRVYECDCDCGENALVDGKNLRNGNTRSCGCLKRDHAKRLGELTGPTNIRNVQTLRSRLNASRTRIGKAPSRQTRELLSLAQRAAENRKVEEKLESSS